MSLPALLNELGLGVYSEKFRAISVTMEQVMEASPNDLDALCSSANMLKGHAVKFKKGVADLKKTSPEKRPKPVEQAQQTPPVRKEPSSPPLSRKEQTPVKPVENGIVDQLKAEINRSLGVLNSISEFKLGLDSFRETILGFDLEAYRKALDDIEALQNYYKSIGVSTSMDLEN
mmetsp:Transcript_19692/g.36247  ORF Transcript_19692/g.36247 Transcript_19692/m.36247 type:complete len:174 (+) Transcript_19692:886-1407(+)